MTQLISIKEDTSREPGYVVLTFDDIPQGLTQLDYALVRTGFSTPYFGPNGWQSEEAWLSPEHAWLADGQLKLLLPPSVTDELDIQSYELVLWSDQFALGTLAFFWSGFPLEETEEAIPPKQHTPLLAESAAALAHAAEDIPKPQVDTSQATTTPPTSESTPGSAKPLLYATAAVIALSGLAYWVFGQWTGKATDEAAPSLSQVTSQPDEPIAGHETISEPPTAEPPQTLATTSESQEPPATVREDVEDDEVTLAETATAPTAPSPRAATPTEVASATSPASETTASETPMVVATEIEEAASVEISAETDQASAGPAPSVEADTAQAPEPPPPVVIAETDQTTPPEAAETTEQSPQNTVTSETQSPHPAPATASVEQTELTLQELGGNGASSDNDGAENIETATVKETLDGLFEANPPPSIEPANFQTPAALAPNQETAPNNGAQETTALTLRALDDLAVSGPDGVMINPLENDISTQGSRLQLVSVYGEKSGFAFITRDPNQPNRIRYKPRANFKGFETLSYTVEDEHGQRAVAQVRIEVTGPAGAATQPAFEGRLPSALRQDNRPNNPEMDQQLQDYFGSQ